MWRTTYKAARRLVVGVIGVTVVLIGVALMVLPGPAFVVIPAGLAILATEFVWARRLLRRVRDHAERGVDFVRDGGLTRRRGMLRTDVAQPPGDDATDPDEATRRAG